MGLCFWKQDEINRSLEGFWGRIFGMIRRGFECFEFGPGSGSTVGIQTPEEGLKLLETLSWITPLKVEYLGLTH